MFLFERRILNINRSSRPNGFKHEKWTRGFTIWGNGRDGKDFFKSLSPESRALVTCFADIDPAKIKRGYYNPNLNVRLPVVHFTEAAPPVAIFETGATLHGPARVARHRSASPMPASMARGGSTSPGTTATPPGSTRSRLCVAGPKASPLSATNQTLASPTAPNQTGPRR